MTRRQTINRRIRRYTYLTLTTIFYTLLFCFVDSDPIAATCFILSITFLILFALSYFNIFKNKENIQDIIIKTYQINPLNLDEINKAYRYKNLDVNTHEILKLFFTKDGKKRCVIYQESNAVKICFETIEYFDDDTKSWILDFAQWIPSEDVFCSGIYADAETAINDNKSFLKDYIEDKTIIEKRYKFNAEIEWLNITIESNIIPFASYVHFDIQIGNKLIKNVILHNRHWFNTSTSASELTVSKNETIDFTKNFKFYIFHKDKIIAKGYYSKKKNFEIY